jgi:hypothetical protein
LGRTASALYRLPQDVVFSLLFQPSFPPFVLAFLATLHRSPRCWFWKSCHTKEVQRVANNRRQRARRSRLKAAKQATKQAARQADEQTVGATGNGKVRVRAEGEGPINIFLDATATSLDLEVDTCSSHNTYRGDSIDHAKGYWSLSRGRHVRMARTTRLLWCFSQITIRYQLE